MKEVTSAEDLVESLSKAGDQLVIVDFFSPGCGGCKALHPKVTYNWIKWMNYMLFNDSKEKCLICFFLWIQFLLLLFVYCDRYVSWPRWTQRFNSFRSIMKSTSPCVIVLMSMFYPSSASTEVLMAVYAALAVLMPRLVFIVLFSYADLTY